MTAMSPAAIGRPSYVASLASSSRMSAARSSATWARTWSIATVLVPCSPNFSRVTTRSRNGSLCGAPASRWVCWRASTSRTTMSACPSAAPRSTACRRFTSGSSLRQLVPSVHCRSRLLGRLQVGHDVAAAEGVDRLLRVADEHHGRVADEGPLDHVPLHRVGVLELVDEDDPPAAPHPGPGGGVGVLQGGGEPAEQVVVAQDPEPALAALELGQHRRRRSRRGPPRSCRRAGSTGVSSVCGLATASRASASACARVSAGASFWCAEAAEVQVVDDLGHQLVEALDERHPGVGVAGHAEGAQHQLAELVRGRDRGGVEAGQRVAQAVPPLRRAPRRCP